MIIRYASGLLFLALLSLGARPAQAQPFILRASVLSAGGQQSTGGNLVLRSTIGQAGAGRAATGTLLLDGGFWPQATRAAGPLALPVAADDVATTDEDTPVEIDVLANDTDPGGGALSIFDFGAPDHGEAYLSGEGLFTYEPEADFFGEDGFVYYVQNAQGGRSEGTVRITVHPVNDAPVITSTPPASAGLGVEYRYTVEAADAEGDALTLSAPVLPGWLALTDHTDGTATLAGTPTAADAGEHPVTLAVSDGAAANEQVFSITVAALAAPVLVAPEDEAVVDPSSGVVVAWRAVPGAATYLLEVATAEDFSTTVLRAGNLTDTTGTLQSLQVDTRYFWRVQAVDAAGVPSVFSAPFQFTTAVAVGTADEAGVPAHFHLEPNYPNPFNPRTTIPYAVPRRTHVRLAVYDLYGRRVALLVDAVQPAGRHQAVFEAGTLPSGTYFDRVEAEGFTATRALTLLK
ncbi:MAG: Ig-like domain-containing protein [Rhodothermales bacterium]|nr:Ig-like domain-containing protein [Rhodothermales bacterium]